MAFTVRLYSGLGQLLRQHPRWQAELRQLILSEDFLDLPTIVRDLAEISGGPKLGLRLWRS